MKTFRSLIMLSLLALSWTAAAEASANPRARREFMRLKQSGEYWDYLGNGTYVELSGMHFIGLQAAFDKARTCLYGFSQHALTDPGRFQVRTRFVCFNTHQYELQLKKEWCEPGIKDCMIDPGGISVGIGNLDVVEPALFGGDRPLPFYPPLLKVDVYGPLRFPKGQDPV